MGVQCGGGYVSSASHQVVSVVVLLDTVGIVVADNMMVNNVVAVLAVDNVVAALAVVEVCVHTQVDLYIFLILILYLLYLARCSRQLIVLLD
jgi:hypothetical protein